MLLLCHLRQEPMGSIEKRWWGVWVVLGSEGMSVAAGMDKEGQCQSASWKGSPLGSSIPWANPDFSPVSHIPQSDNLRTAWIRVWHEGRSSLWVGSLKAVSIPVWHMGHTCGQEEGPVAGNGPVRGAACSFGALVGRV